MVKKEIFCYGNNVIVACDEKCNKAWGINNRPKKVLDKDNPDDYAFLSDTELGEAPQDPGTYEGGHGKPSTPEEKPNKWCIRECERMELFKPTETITLRDFSKRRFNITRRFYEKAQEKKNTVPLTEKAAEIFMVLTFADQKDKQEEFKIPEEELPFTCRIVQKRIEALKLPITFSKTALFAVDLFAMGNPGRAVALLVDCLTKYEGLNIGMKELTELYPWGFYNTETFEDYVDNYLKPRKLKWAEIY